VHRRHMFEEGLCGAERALLDGDTGTRNSSHSGPKVGFVDWTMIPIRSRYPRISGTQRTPKSIQLSQGFRRSYTPAFVLTSISSGERPDRHFRSTAEPYGRVVGAELRTEVAHKRAVVDRTQVGAISGRCRSGLLPKSDDILGLDHKSAMAYHLGPLTHKGGAWIVAIK
jgi:hypothetical protein